MKKLSILLFGLFLVAAIGCNNPKQKAETDPDMRTSEVAPDYRGAYEGTLPCADCEGIKTRLTIKDDGTFVLNSEYLGEEDNKFEDKGTYFIENGEILVTQDQDGDQKYYRIQAGSLLMLDADKKAVEGEIASYYILKRTD